MTDLHSSSRSSCRTAGETTIFEGDVADISAIDAVPLILEVICRITDMGFAAVVRVTEDRWIACQVREVVVRNAEEKQAPPIAGASWS